MEDHALDPQPDNRSNDAVPQSHYVTTPVMRMLRRINVSTNNFDFDDILRRFERRFGSQHANSDDAPSNESPATDDTDTERRSDSVDGNTSQNLEPTTPSTAVLTVHDFSHDFSRLLADFCALPRIRHEVTGLLAVSSDRSISVPHTSIEVTRAQIQREILRFSGRLTEIDKFLSGTDDSEHRASIASLKRKVREREKEIERVKNVAHKGNLEVRKLQGHIAQIASERDDAKDSVLDVKKEKKKLISEIDSLKRAIRQNASENDEMYKQQQRYERCISSLRGELLQVHHERNAIKLELNLLQKRMLELEHHREEARKSENIILPKVTELQQLQNEMLELMSQVDSGNTRARNALGILKRKRTKLISRIATVVSKRTSEAEDSLAHADATSGPDTSSVRENDTIVPVQPDRVMNTNNRPGPSAGPGGLQRKMTNMFRRRGWNSIQASTGDREGAERSEIVSTTDSGGGRNPYAAMRYAGARAHRSAISEIDSLRAVLERKENELQRVECELMKTRDKTDSLERELYYERQYRRRENRNLRGAELTKGLEMVAAAREEKLAHNTLFDWQNNVTPEDGEKTSKVPPPMTEEELAEMYSPVSSDGRLDVSLRKVKSSI